MKRMESEGLKSGKATVKESKDGGKFQIVFEDGEKYVVTKADCPDAMQAGNWVVTMNGDGGVMGLRPYGVICKAKFSHFVTDENDIPTPKQYEGKFGPYHAFIALVTLGEEYKGMMQPLFLVYKFAEYEGNTVIQGGGAWVDRLQAFLEACGIMDQDIPFEDNLLPTLQKMILVENRVFALSIKIDGFVDSVTELTKQETTSEDDFSLASSEPEEGEDDDFSDDEEDDSIPF